MDERDPKSLVDEMKEICSSGEQKACIVAASPTHNPDTNDALARSYALCRQKVPDGCGAAAVILGKRGDLDAAFQYARQECELSESGCLRLMGLYDVKATLESLRESAERESRWHARPWGNRWHSRAISCVPRVCFRRMR